MEKYNVIIDEIMADQLMRQDAVHRRKNGVSGLGELLIIGEYGIWVIVGRAQYDQFARTFSYDGGIQLRHGGSCDRSGGYKSLNELIKDSVKKAQDWYIQYDIENPD